MKVLVACEFSGIVRDAFKAKGHDAWSCDLLPTERPGLHIQGDVLRIIDKDWDLMIAHPPCTYLSYAGIAHWNRPGRCKKRLEALEFFRQLWEAPIEKICIENPKGCASPTIAKYNQVIQPFYFGDREYKTTWLWLKNLLPLIHIEQDTFFETKTHTEKPEPISIDDTPRKKPRYFVDAKTRSPHKRSVTFQGIADAMATQWNF
ncbi:hypothetical protein LCGC14_1595490 [marine sediment metagenome]|uniref:DNA cytosine methyltransferase n=1 Tax=marine sediment metagenome TaxID=412755 RepID=A0A0F9ID37_9ZZZZ